jgi:hypothetical protein
VCVCVQFKDRNHLIEGESKQGRSDLGLCLNLICRNKGRTRLSCAIRTSHFDTISVVYRRRSECQGHFDDSCLSAFISATNSNRRKRDSGHCNHFFVIRQSTIRFNEIAAESQRLTRANMVVADPNRNLSLSLSLSSCWFKEW